MCSLRTYNNYLNMETVKDISVGDRCICRRGTIGTVTSIRFNKDRRKKNLGYRITYIGIDDDGRRWQSYDPVKITG